MRKITLPLSIEREYQKEIRKILTRAKDILKQNLFPALPYLVSEAKSKRADDDNSERMDEDVSQKIAEIFAATKTMVDAQITQYEIERLAQRTALEVSAWNKNQIHAIFKQALGVRIFSGEPYLQETLNLFVINNVNLIKNVNQQFLDQAENVVFRGIMQGTRHERIAKQILNGTNLDPGRFRKAKTRANLIGRDQVSKLNGNLTHLRQTEAGIKKYRWRTVGDGRVRDRHAAWEGDIVEWSKGKEGGTHPGDEIQCRCWAEPIFEDIL